MVALAQTQISGVLKLVDPFLALKGKQWTFQGVEKLEFALNFQLASLSSRRVVVDTSESGSNQSKDLR